MRLKAQFGFFLVTLQVEAFFHHGVPNAGVMPGPRENDGRTASLTRFRHICPVS